MLAIILGVFVVCFGIERLWAGWILPSVRTWPLRALAINGLQGNHDRLPLSTIFLNRSSSPGQATRSKANASNSSAGGYAPANPIFCCCFPTIRAD